MEMSTEIGALAAALAKAQHTMKGAAKDSTNPHFKSKYADLASVWDAAREALTVNGLSIVQGASADAEKVTVTTLLLHTSGQWVKDALTASARDAGPQSVGSCITYGRRYGLAAMVGIAPEDDDAEAATSRYAPGAKVTMPPPVEIQPASAKLAAEINAGLAAGAAKVAPAKSFAQPVRKPNGRPAPPPEPEQLPPLTDEDIPF